MQVFVCLCIGIPIQKHTKHCTKSAPLFVLPHEGFYEECASGEIIPTSDKKTLRPSFPLTSFIRNKLFPDPVPGFIEGGRIILSALGFECVSRFILELMKKQ